MESSCTLARTDCTSHQAVFSSQGHTHTPHPRLSTLPTSSLSVNSRRSDHGLLLYLHAGSRTCPLSNGLLRIDRPPRRPLASLVHAVLHVYVQVELLTALERRHCHRTYINAARSVSPHGIVWGQGLRLRPHQGVGRSRRQAGAPGARPRRA
jgi:hypothetical protein